MTKDKVLSVCNNEWQTKGAIAKKAELYPFAVKPLLDELVQEGKIEFKMFNKRGKFRRVSLEMPLGSPELPIQETSVSAETLIAA